MKTIFDQFNTTDREDSPDLILTIDRAELAAIASKYELTIKTASIQPSDDHDELIGTYSGFNERSGAHDRSSAEAEAQFERALFHNIGLDGMLAVRAVVRDGHFKVKFTAEWNFELSEHVPVKHGLCPVCGQYGEDCTAKEDGIAGDPHFTEANLDEVRQAALDRGFEAFTNAEGRTIYLNEEAPGDGVDILLLDHECVWLDRYIHDPYFATKAESDGTASTIAEVIAAMKQGSATVGEPLTIQTHLLDPK